MNSLTKSVIAALAGAMTFAATAQTPPGAPGQDGPPPGRGGPGARHHRPPSPIVQALDANQDRVIDAAELAGAAAALKKLDTNGDGKLTADEYAPHPPKGDGSNHGPDGQNPPPVKDGPDSGGGPRPHHPMDPLVIALDTNGDGVIDADEIANATKALKALDKNGNGQLTPEEFAPPRPERGPGAAAEHPDRKPKSE